MEENSEFLFDFPFILMRVRKNMHLKNACFKINSLEGGINAQNFQLF